MTTQQGGSTFAVLSAENLNCSAAQEIFCINQKPVKLIFTISPLAHHTAHACASTDVNYELQHR